MEHTINENSARMHSRPDLRAASDEMIDDAIRFVDPMALRGLLYQLTGDETLKEVAVTKHLINGLLDLYQVENPDDAARIRAQASRFLKDHRDSGASDLDIGPRERLRESLMLTAGIPIPEEEAEMWIEEIGIDPWARGLSWPDGRPPTAVADFPVIVIGAGMGGLNAAVHLRNADIPFTVLEKGTDIGGTWRDNRYPGARLDTPSRMYTHLFGVGYPYPNQYALQDANQGYLQWIADEFDLREHVRLGTEVTSLTWDEATSEWSVLAIRDGRPLTLRARAVISSVGFLSQPNIPSLPGLEEFEGDWFHTARWPEDFNAHGKRMAVVGTGCTGYQMIPELAKQTSHLTVFQRTPNWLYAAPGYLKPFPEQNTWIDGVFPFLASFERFQMAFMQRAEITARRLRRDPDFVDEHAVSAVNKVIRANCIAALEEKLGDRPDLLEKMIPAAPPMAARPVLYDPEYSILDVIKQDDVSLVSDGIRRILPNGIETNSGEFIELDAIVLATGFKANDFLWPMEVRGRDGVSLSDIWGEDGARAYLGSMVPGFPNFFMIYGPNTNLTVGFQIVDMLELSARFALENIGALIESGNAAVEVTEDGFRRYNAEIDKAEPTMIYSDPRARNYYTNAFGRSAANNPIDNRVLWNWMRDPAGRRTPRDGRMLAEQFTEIFRAITPRQGADLVVR